MIVAICQTKQGPLAKKFYKAFARGVENSGDHVVRVTRGFPHTDVNYFVNLLNQCDVSFQVCDAIGQKSGFENANTIFRSQIKREQEKNKKRRIILDSGYTNNMQGRERLCFLTGAEKEDKHHYSLGFDGIKNEAHFYNKNSPKDRWEKLNLELVPWRESGEHILVLGQSEVNVGMKHVRKLLDIKKEPSHGEVLEIVGKEFEELVCEVRKVTNRKIIFRYHPHQGGHIAVHPHAANVHFTHVTGEFGAKATSLNQDLKNCWATVCIGGTNSAVDAVLEGIPAVCPSTMNQAYEMCEHDLSNIENPAMPDRSQWAYNLAYTQWNLKEIEEGLPWRHLRRFV